MRTKIIVFDFDNTIIEYKRTCLELHRKAAELLGLRPPSEEELARLAGMPWDYMIGKIWPGTEPQAFKGAYHRIPNRKSQIQGAAGAIEELSKEHSLCILSSKSRQAILAQLSEAGIPPSSFTSIISTGDTGASKPDPRIFEGLKKEIGPIKPSELLYVGDSIVDALAAASAGIRFIGVLSGWVSRQDFGKAGFYETVQSIAELPEYLGSLPELSSIEDAVEDLKAGKFVIVLDDARRENEGDLVLAAQHATPEKTAFLIRNTSGVICAPASNEILGRLELRPLVGRNTDKFQTPFTVSIDSKKCAGSGVSAEDRCATILSLADPASMPEQFGRPGHLFPLRPDKNGVLGRRGHTEAAVDLMKMAGLAEVAAIGELMGTDGTMLRGRRLSGFARQNKLRTVRIEDIVKHRLKTEKLVRREASADLPTPFGNFTIIAYSNAVDSAPIIALVMGEAAGRAVPVRVHSECFTGEALLSKRCDCREQLSAAMSLIERSGSGVIVYLKQEGRGIGLLNKLRAYSLQDGGLDTVEANLELGLRPDGREYWAAAQVLRDLGVSRISLLTNNPKKSAELEEYGISISEVLPLSMAPNESNRDYLEAKKLKFCHAL